MDVSRTQGGPNDLECSCLVKLSLAYWPDCRFCIGLYDPSIGITAPTKREVQVRIKGSGIGQLV